MYKGLVKGWMKHLDFLFLDVICLEISFLIAYIIRNGLQKDYMPPIYKNLMIVIVLVDICAVFFNNSYDEIVRRGVIAEFKRVCVHCTWNFLGIILWLFAVKQSNEYSRYIIFLMYPISIAMMFFVRIFWKQLVRKHIRSRKKVRKLLIVTTDERADIVARELLLPYREYLIEGIVIYDDDERIGHRIANIPVCAGKDTVIDYLKEHVVDEIFLDLPDREKDEEFLMNLFVNMGLTVHENLLKNTPSMENKMLHRFGKYTVLSASMKFASPRQVFLKRAMDIVGAIVGLVFTGIAFIFVAPIIYIQSPGKIFFGQARVGRNGRIFKIYKFRTMYPDAEERKKELMKQNKMQGLMFKMDNDPRIFPFGHFLRKTSIDELPQFWNILKGDMSLVGTRPPTLDEYKQYEPKHRKRLAMKPGLTGLWQVSGRSDIVDFEEVVALDAKYIQEWTLAYDIKIIWKTVMLIFTGKGAV